MEVNEPRNPPCEIKICSSIKELSPAEWNSLFPKTPESWNFHKTIEETLTGQFKFYYAAAYRDSRVVCILPCFVMDYPLDTTIMGPLEKPAGKLIALLRRFIPRFFTLRMLICGSPTGEGKIGLPPSGEYRKLLVPMVRRLEEVAAREKAGTLMFKDFPEQYNAFLDPLEQASFHKIRSYPLVELDIRFNDFEEYFSTLSRPTKKDLKRKFRKADSEAALTMEVRSGAGEHLDEIYRLYLATYEKSPVKFEKVTKDFFLKISGNMPEETRYFLWFRGGKLVAFDLCLVSDGLLIDEYVGMDYGVAYDLHLYFATFRDIVRWCIGNGVRKYKSGALNYDPKKRLDLDFLPQSIFMRHKNRLMNFFLGILTRSLKPENFDPTLRALNETAKARASSSTRSFPPPEMPSKTMKNKGKLGFKVFSLIILTDVLEALSQLFFKQGALATGMDEVHWTNLGNYLAGALASPGPWLAVLCIIVNFFLWVTVITRIDLSVAYPVSSTSYVFVPLLSVFCLHEHMSLLRWVGTLLIIGGIFFVSKSAKDPKEDFNVS